MYNKRQAFYRAKNSFGQITFFSVWRGFNGNIYFEPMVLNNMNKKKAENDKVDKAVNLRQNYDFVRMMSNIETSVKEKTPSTECQKIVAR
ncbi:hypothetical protein BpHYR1_029565 [Brachionus plicatilis]|uniref:Uncharacterized protein n=1 Tax=Brachionus plicatilis TaxID=10195 RepID=A0A3M7P8S4_BRAPC|nr:hypothetical protein BpHYR1_029565 [Brachionus plicatilis]